MRRYRVEWRGSQIILSCACVGMLFLATLVPLLAADAQSHLESLGVEPTRCSACEIVATKFDDAIASPKLIKGWKEWTTEQRVSKLKAAFGKACPKIENMQVCKYGNPPKFGDFQELLSKGGGMSDLSMGPEQRRTVQTLCEQLSTKNEVTRVVRLIEEALEPPSKGSKTTRKRRRLVDLRMRAEVCQRLLGTCKEEEEEEEEADEDEDDREL